MPGDYRTVFLRRFLRGSYEESGICEGLLGRPRHFQLMNPFQSSIIPFVTWYATAKERRIRMEKIINILGFAGSLRKDSYNKQAK